MKLTLVFVFLQPVGFVTFNTRAGAEAAKQDLQVGVIFGHWRAIANHIRILAWL